MHASFRMADNILCSGSSGSDIQVWRHPKLNEPCKIGHGVRTLKNILVLGPMESVWKCAGGSWIKHVDIIFTGKE